MNKLAQPIKKEEEPDYNELAKQYMMQGGNQAMEENLVGKKQVGRPSKQKEALAKILASEPYRKIQKAK